MKTNKKGVELSMNMVIIMAILLVVLIVAVLIFIGGFEDFAKKLAEIKAQVWTAKPNLTMSGR